MGQAGSTFQYWCCLTLLIIRPCFQLLITFSYLDWNFPHWMSASGWTFWNFLARTVAIFENRSNGKGITFNIWKKLCKFSVDSTSILCTESTNSVKDMMDSLNRVKGGVFYHPGEKLSKVCSVLKKKNNKKPCSLYVLEIWAPQDFIPYPPVSGVGRWETADWNAEGGRWPEEAVWGIAGDPAKELRRRGESSGGLGAQD